MRAEHAATEAALISAETADLELPGDPSMIRAIIVRGQTPPNSRDWVDDDSPPATLPAVAPDRDVPGPESVPN
ncbi:MAG TPA: hypothetical protein VGR16_00585, partial [Thermomicrobiales bacterium]|nr:hypothetical protein [Thermomicrobiales bacterium]